MAISPSPETALRAARDELSLPFELASDESERAVSTLCGGVSHCVLMLDPDGRVRWGAWSESWADAPPFVTILQNAYALRP